MPPSGAGTSFPGEMGLAMRLILTMCIGQGDANVFDRVYRY